MEKIIIQQDLVAMEPVVPVEVVEEQLIRLLKRCLVVTVVPVSS